MFCNVIHTVGVSIVSIVSIVSTSMDIAIRRIVGDHHLPRESDPLLMYTVHFSISM